MPSLTKEFIELTLLGESITAFELSSGSAIGDNSSSDIKSLIVTLSDGRHLNLIYKTFPINQGQRKFVISGKLFRHESAIYKFVIPQIQILFPQWIPHLPKFYSAFNDDLSDYLCITDLRPNGYQMGDKFCGLSNTEVRLVLDHLAKFHAFSYLWISKKGEQIFDQPELSILAKNYMTTNINWEITNAKIEGTLSFALTFVDPEDAKLIRHRIPNAEEAGRLYMDTGMRTMEGTLYFPVIVHGDLWVNNILFKYDADGCVSDLTFIDFQQSHRGNIFEDLHFFIFSSSTVEMRNEYLLSWLQVYYNSFVESIQGVECPLPVNFNQESFLASYWTTFTSGYVSMAYLLPFHLGNHDGDAKTNSRLPFTRPRTDLEAIDELLEKCQTWMNGSSVAQQRFYDMTKEILKLNVF